MEIYKINLKNSLPQPLPHLRALSLKKKHEKIKIKQLKKSFLNLDSDFQKFKFS